VCSIDKAEQIQSDLFGLNWWRYDRNLAAPEEEETTILRLERRIAELERQLGAARTTAAEPPESPPTT
jgi:hypothetical protein